MAHPGDYRVGDPGITKDMQGCNCCLLRAKYYFKNQTNQPNKPNQTNIFHNAGVLS